MVYKRSWLIPSLILAAGPLFAATDPPKAEEAPKVEIEVQIDGLNGKNRISACEMDLESGKTTLISSGRDEDTLPNYIEYIEYLTQRNGLMAKLGMKLPPHIFLFIPGQLAGVLSAMNMVPMGHYIDGSRVAQAQSTNSGILELVFPGGQHSFYRDDLSSPKQLSIINHAYLGHAWFAVHSKYSANRTAEAVSDSYKLYEMIERAYLHNDPAEVAEWYAFLMSTENDQDMIQAVEESPAEFRKFAEDGRKRKDKNRLFQVPRTRNLLQYIISQLPADLPPWKLEIAAQFEKLRRYIPGAYNTKVMNEGWATLMMELAPEHSVIGGDFVHNQEYCCLLNNVGTSRGNLSKDLDNPYYMGVEGWKILRERFHLRPEMFNKSKIERDRAFVAWATSEVIAKMNDREFFDYAFSDKWLLRKNMNLSKNLGDQDPKGRPVKGDPTKFKPPGVVEIISKDPKAIRRALVRINENMLLSMATPSVRPLREPGGVIELEMVDGWGKYQPLKSRGLVAKLWVLSRMVEKPIAMESTYITKTAGPAPASDPFAWLGFWAEKMSFRRENTDKPEFWRLHTTVYPDGRVHVRKVLRNGVSGPDSVEDPDKYNLVPPQHRQFEEWPSINDRFQTFLDEFLVDWYADANYEDAVARVPRLGQDDLLKKALSSAIDTGSIVGAVGDGIGTEVYDHSPTVPRALHEYQKKIGSRLENSLKKAVFGKSRSTLNQGMLRVRVLPTIPHFEYNPTFNGRKIHRDKKFDGQFEDELTNSIQDQTASSPLLTGDIRGPLLEDLMQAGGVTVEALDKIKEAFTRPTISQHNLLTLIKEISPSRASSINIRAQAAEITPEDLDEGDVGISSGPGSEGEPFWGPGQPKQGGKGNQDGEPQPAKDGEEPANGRDDTANDPSFVDVPPDIWGRILAEEIELPNTRPLDDADQRRSKVVAKKARRKAGVMRPELISREAFKLGLVELQNESGVDHPDDLLDALAQDPQAVHASGYRRLREQDWWVKGSKYKPSPDIKAVVYVIVDLSGSMMGWFNTVKRMSVDLQAILQSKYPAVELRFVPFDGKAMVLKNINDLLKLKLAGGTSYGSAFRETKKDMDLNFPYAEYDRYVVIQGDLIDTPQNTDWEDFMNMHKRAQYSGVLHTGGGGSSWGGFEGYEKVFKELKENDEFFGYETIATPQDYVPIIFRALFKNPPKE